MCFHVHMLQKYYNAEKEKRHVKELKKSVLPDRTPLILLIIILFGCNFQPKLI